MACMPPNGPTYALCIRHNVTRMLGLGTVPDRPFLPPAPLVRVALGQAMAQSPPNQLGSWLAGWLTDWKTRRPAPEPRKILGFSMPPRQEGDHPAGALFANHAMEPGGRHWDLLHDVWG